MVVQPNPKAITKQCHMEYQVYQEKVINDKVAFVGVPPSADALKQVVRSFSMA